MTQLQIKNAIPSGCWSCSFETPDHHFCTACGRIQALPPGADYFSLFDLPQKLQLDAGELEKKFHQLNWKLHPDNFMNASERERALSMEQSSQINDAYRTLRDPIRRVEYLLQRAGVRKEGTTKQQAPPELLEEVFELNEWLDELRTARQGSEDGEVSELRHRLEAAQHNFEQKLGEVDAQLESEFGAWDAALDAGADGSKRAALMQRLNEVLNRRSYIRNLVTNVQKELSG
ncbi:MAG: Fe-S protein assembly co-chaperone HscB [Acidobacteria bacterium]|nr:Fe-S protein assembly co-chaperone HscB [Acidobacteriota bacterium]